MIISCHNCHKKLKIAEEKLPQDKAKVLVRCPSCQAKLIIDLAAHRKQSPARQADETQIGKEADETEINTNLARIKRAKLVNMATQQEYHLEIGKQNIVGRSQTADISIPDAHLSRQHCAIDAQIKGGSSAYVLIDQNSTNGTFYNGKKLSSFDKPYLSHNDKITIGHTELKVILF